MYSEKNGRAEGMQDTDRMAKHHFQYLSLENKIW